MMQWVRGSANATQCSVMMAFELLSQRMSAPTVIVELLRAHRRKAATPLQAGAVWTDLDLGWRGLHGGPERRPPGSGPPAVQGSVSHPSLPGPGGRAQPRDRVSIPGPGPRVSRVPLGDPWGSRSRAVGCDSSSRPCRRTHLTKIGQKTTRVAPADAELGSDNADPDVWTGPGQ
jgi:hypothetical protein